MISPFTLHRKRRQAGQSLAEFALVAPILFLLLFGIIQLGIVFGTQNGLVNGVREAARRAATYRINQASDDDASVSGGVWQTICASVKTELRELGDRTIPAYAVANLHPTVAYEWQADPESGEYFLVAHVSATYDNPLYVPIISFFLDRSDGVTDGKLTLTASEQMRVENPALKFSSAPAAMAACP